MYRKSTFIVVLLVVFSLVTSAIYAQGGGRGNRDGHHQQGPRMGDLAPQLMQIITEATNLTPQEIGEQMRDGATLSEVIEANGGDVAEIAEEAQTLITEHIQQAVENDRLTQERSDTLLDELPQRIQDVLNGDAPLFQDKNNRRGGMHNPFADPMQENIMAEIGRVIGEETGLSPEEIREQMRDGATFVEMIEANGSSVESVLGSVTTAVSERVEEAVTNGDLSREQADTILSHLEDRMTDVLNHAGGMRQGPQGNSGRPGQQNNLPQHRLVIKVAEAVDAPVEEIVQQVRDGSTLGEILEGNGITVETFVDELVTDQQERMAEAVEDGKMSQAVADARLNLFRVETLDWLTRTAPNNQQ